MSMSSQCEPVAEIVMLEKTARELRELKDGPRCCPGIALKLSELEMAIVDAQQQHDILEVATWQGHAVHPLPTIALRDSYNNAPIALERMHTQ